MDVGASAGGRVVYKVIDQPNPLIILIAVLAAFQVYASILREKTDRTSTRSPAASARQLQSLYFALVIFLGHQTWMTYGPAGALEEEC